MQTIKLEFEIHENILEKFLSFVDNLSKKELVVKKDNSLIKIEHKDDLVTFFQKSPLSSFEELKFDRNSEIYQDRVKF